MLTKSLILASFIAIGVAQQIPSSIPACAGNCTTSIAQKYCGNVINVSCLCTNTVYQAAVLQCMGSACSTNEVQTAASAGQQACQAAGFNLTLPSNLTSPNSSSTGAPAPTVTNGSSNSSSSSSSSSSSAASTLGGGSFIYQASFIVTTAITVMAAQLL